MSDVGGEIAENCGFEGKILCEVPQSCAPREKSDILPGSKWKCRTYGFTVTVIGLRPDREISYLADDGKTYSSPRHVWRELYEPWPQPEPETTSEQLAEIEGQAEPVQVREGRWRTRNGDIRNVTPTPECDNRHDRFPWRDTAYDQTWTANGRYRYQCGAESPRDLVKYLGPIEPQSEPQPEPQPQPPMLQDADQMIRLLSEANHNHVAMIGRLQGRINDLETIRDNQAATIEELRSEVSYVQRLLGESRQRVTQLEELVGSLRTINEAQEKSFNAANKANDDLQHRLNVVSAEWAEQAETLREQFDAATAELQKRHSDHVGRAISTDEWMDQFARDASVSRLQADRNDLAGKVISLREQLQQANDRLAFLETLQPIAAACHTAQTMVRDMLGHMRCLLALQHTTDRRNFCTLLESILEVFDEAECDEDEDEDTDTTNTSEAGQG